MYMKNDIDTKLKKIIIKHSKKEITKEDINNISNLVIDFSFDSVMLMTLVIEIESEFGIHIDDEDLDLGILIKYDTLKNLLLKIIGEN